MKSPFVIGSDIGGTFTDCVVLGADGDMVIAKAPSTPPDFEVGLWDALGAAADKLDLSIERLLGDAERLAHGTTVATNALINERGARVGFLTTKGFEETLWQMRGSAYCQGLPMERWYNKLANPRPFELVAPARTIGISERIDSTGTVLCALNEGEVREAVRRLVEDEGAEAIAVGLLWSFANDAHERRTRDIIREHYPDLPVTLSSELIPVHGEYERWSTTAMNAYLRPEVENYVRRMLAKLATVPRAPGVFFMQANGGVSAPERAVEQSVRLLQSGPVGGVVAGLTVAQSLDTERVLTADMGGTSFDVCLLDGEAPYSQRSVHNRHVVAARMIDIESIGAGGGSIARVLRGNLRVGPDSAGASPGPACYSRGGTVPTVTDANVVLGYLNPAAILGGRMPLDVGAAQEAIRTQIAEPLGLSVEDAALGIVRVVNAHMADLLRFHTLRRGRDPRDYLVLCFGGATPLHAAGIADELGCPRMVVPLAGTATVLSAYGIAETDQAWFFSLSRAMVLEPDSASALDEAFTELEATAREQIARDGAPLDRVTWVRTASARYRLQTNELDVPVPAGRMTPAKVKRLVRAFDRTYSGVYGKNAGYQEGGRQLVAVHLAGMLPSDLPPVAAHPLQAESPDAARGDARPCYFTDQGWTDTPVYDGDRLQPGNVVDGPAVLEMEGTTILVPPGSRATYDAYRHVSLETHRGDAP